MRIFATGQSIDLEEAPRRPGDPAILVASAAKIEREIGWTAQVRSLKDMVRSAWE